MSEPASESIILYLLGVPVWLRDGSVDPYYLIRIIPA